jgi:hypothetical protein
VKRLILSCTLIALFAVPAPSRADDTTKAAATRKVLKTKKITVDFDDVRLEEIVEDLKEKTGLKFLLDSKGGVSRNSKFSYKGKDQTLEEVFAGLFAKSDLGYFIDQSKAYDGLIKITKGGERGYEKGKEPK